MWRVFRCERRGVFSIHRLRVCIFICKYLNSIFNFWLLNNEMKIRCCEFIQPAHTVTALTDTVHNQLAMCRRWYEPLCGDLVENICMTAGCSFKPCIGNNTNIMYCTLTHFMCLHKYALLRFLRCISFHHGRTVRTFFKKRDYTPFNMTRLYYHAK